MSGERTSAPCDYCADCKDCSGNVLVHIFADTVAKNMDHEDFIRRVLTCVCCYYGANWCGVIDADLPLGVWTPRYWYDAETGWMADTLFYNNESAAQFEHWVLALRNEKTVAYETIEDLRENCPDEYEQYVRLQVKSFMGVPYYQGGNGFVVVKNLTQRQHDAGALMAAANVLGSALRDIQDIEAARLLTKPDQDADENTVVAKVA